METTDRESPVLVRCVKCHCPQARSPDGWCRACNWSAPVERWEAETRLHPIQPEERNGHRCLECGEKVVVTMPLRPPIQNPLLQWTVFGAVFGGLAALAGAPFRVMVWCVVPAALALPMHLLYRRFRGPDHLRRIVVRCRTCGFLRIGGRTVESVTGSYRRGARTFDGIYRKLLPVCGFFLVVMVGALVTDTVPTGVNIALCVVSGFTFHAVRWYRGAFGLRSWW